MLFREETKLKKVLCLLLALLTTLCLFSGCAGGETVPSSEKTEGLTPLSDPNAIPNLQGRTITILTTDTWVSGLSISDVLPKFRQIEERTGCTIVWETAPSGGDFNTVLQTRLTGDPSECPDIILLPTNTTTLSKYISEGLLFDLTKAYDYCPNIKAFYEEKRTDLKGSFTYEDGGIYNLLSNVSVTSEDQRKNIAETGDNAIWYRADIAKELGWDTYPKTMDELHELLTQVHEAYPDMVPMHMYDWGGWESAKIFNSAYGLHFNNEECGTFFYPDENGTVQFEPALEATKQWLTEINKWYTEGLIVVGNSEEQKIGAAAKGVTFSGFYASVTEMCESALKQLEPDAYFLYMPFPTAGDSTPTLMPRCDYYNSFSIVDNGDEEQCLAAAQFLDYAFLSYYGMCSEVLGVEGEGWSLDENGKFTPNKEYIAELLTGDKIREFSGANIHFNGPTTFSYEISKAYRDARIQVREEMGYEDPMNAEQKANWLEINEINVSYYQSIYPLYYMQPEDQDEYTRLYSDIETYTQEMLERYILGTADLNTFESEFVSTLYNRLQLQKVLDIQQKYYDIYLENAAK